MLHVMDIAEDPSIRLLVIGAGSLCCLFGVASLLAVTAHLKRNKKQLYKEEISATSSRQGNKAFWLQVIDSLFVMILCFVTLLSAMLVNKDTVDGINYSIHAVSVSVTILGLIFYLYYLLNQSDKGLKAIVQHIYDKK